MTTTPSAVQAMVDASERLQHACNALSKALKDIHGACGKSVVHCKDDDAARHPKLFQAWRSARADWTEAMQDLRKLEAQSMGGTH